MASENRAPPIIEAVATSSIESTPYDPIEDAKLVHGSAQTKAPVRRWSWSKKKKEALRLVMGGSAIVDVAEKVGAHRNSIMLWMKAPEWLAEAQRLVGEGQLSTKLRRLKMTSVIADQLGVKAVQALKDDNFNPATTGLLLREHTSYVKAERELYGEGAQPQQGSQGGTIQIVLGGSGPNAASPVDEGKQATAVLALKDFMKGYDPNLAVVAHSPQEAMLLLAEKVLQESNLLDMIREEDRAEMRSAQEAEEAGRRRR